MNNILGRGTVEQEPPPPHSFQLTCQQLRLCNAIAIKQTTKWPAGRKGKPTGITKMGGDDGS